jgi:methylmalonyl-CoA/ethylmalonyl-CoA epimerase
LNTDCYKEELVESEAVKTAFFSVGTQKIELLESTGPDGIIARFIEKKGEGIHHIAFAVTDIHSEIKRLVAAGFVVLNEKPRPGADNKLVCLHPKNTTYLELCMENREARLIRSIQLISAVTNTDQLRANQQLRIILLLHFFSPISIASLRRSGWPFYYMRTLEINSPLTGPYGK